MLREKIEEKIDNLGLADKVIMAGNRTDVPSMLMAMDVFVFPSKYEGFGIVLVEAQCTGVPCVISNVIPRESIINKEGITVLSFQDTAAAWASAVLDSHVNDRQACMDLVKKAGFDIADTAGRMEDFYLGKGK